MEVVVSVIISDLGVENRHGELVWTARVEAWQPPWSPKERACGSLAASTESHG